MTDKDLFARALRNRWWIVLLVLGTAIAAARYFTSRQTSIYRATASSTVAPAATLTETADLLRALETLERRTVLATFASLPRSRDIREAANQMLAPGGRALDSYRISASVVPNTNIIRVEAQGPDAALAADVANAVALATAEKANRLYPLFVLEPLDVAVPVYAAVYPNAQRSLMVAGVLGLLLGFAVMLGMEVLASLLVSAPARHRQRHAQPDAV